MSRYIDVEKLSPFDNSTMFYYQILNAHTEDVRPVVRGKWNILGCDLYMCSKCYAKFTHKFNFCPDCGADMREVDTYDCKKCRHDGFICDECENGSEYEE